MLRTSTKPCKHCSETGHSAFTCTRKPRKALATKKRIKKMGKVTRRWLQTRNEWLAANPADDYYCHYCNIQLDRAELTLDHYQSRSRHPELRFELSNLVPSCAPCNRDKGSLSGDEYIEKRKESYGRN